MRQNPKQSRANQTISDIAQATTQLLDAEDGRKFTTNHIAERAGVSIGTLYRYFPDKGAILRFVARREIARTSKRVNHVIDHSGANTAQTLLDEVIAESLTAFDGKHRVRRQFRELAQADPILTREMADLRMSITLHLNARLAELDPDAFGHVCDDTLAAACETFKSATLAMDQHMTCEHSIAQLRSRLAAALLGTLKQEEPHHSRV